MQRVNNCFAAALPDHMSTWPTTEKFHHGRLTTASNHHLLTVCYSPQVSFYWLKSPQEAVTQPPPTWWRRTRRYRRGIASVPKVLAHRLAIRNRARKKSLVLCGELKQTDCLSESALLCYFGWQHLSHQTIAEPVYRSRGVLASDPTCAVGGTSHAAERWKLEQLQMFLIKKKKKRKKEGAEITADRTSSTKIPCCAAR